MFVWQNRKKEETRLEYDFKYKCSVSIINKPVKQGCVVIRKKNFINEMFEKVNIAEKAERAR